MKRAGVNRRGLRRELALKLGPKKKHELQKKLKRTVNRALRAMLLEFNSHPVTKEIEAGPRAQNISGTLGGAGNLFSFIGFDDGDNPIAPVRRILEQSTRLVSVTQLKDKLIFE